MHVFIVYIKFSGIVSNTNPDLKSPNSGLFFLLCSLVVTGSNSLCHVTLLLLVLISFRPLLWHLHAPSHHFLQQCSDAEVRL